MCKDSQISRVFRLIILPAIKNIRTLKTNLLLRIQRIGNITLKLEVMDTNNSQVFVEMVHINTSAAKRSITSKFTRKARLPKHIAHHFLHQGYSISMLRCNRNIVTEPNSIPKG